MNHRRAALLAGAVAVPTALVRVVSLGRPPTFVFDELYYAHDALTVLRSGVETQSVAHPPLGKSLLALGVWAFGDGPTGWRVVPLVAGVLTVWLTVWAAARFTGSAWLAVAAGALVATDGVSFTMGRTAMLDGLVTPLLLGVVICLVHMAASAGAPSTRLVATAGALLGAASAVKWAGLLLFAVGALVVAWSSHRGGLRLRRALLGGVLFAAVGVATYAAAFAGWVVHYEEGPLCAGRHECEPGIRGRVDALVEYHRSIADYHSSLDSKNRYAVPAWHWFDDAAVLYRVECEPDAAVPPSICAGDGQGAGIEGTEGEGQTADDPDAGEASEAKIVARPSPLPWLFATAALVGVLVARRLRGGHKLGRVVVLAGSLWALLVPWVAIGREGYSFYVAPMVPLLALLTATCSAALVPRRAWAWVSGVVVLASLAGLAIEYPELTARTWW